jgi:hypothetical protein
MNIRNVLQNGVVFVMLVSILLGVPAQSASAANTTMSQSILPVRFVYLQKDGNINRIWSNVTEKDEVYVVKFFDEKKKEVPMDKKNILEYTQKSQTTIVSKQSTQEIQFVAGSDGIEEIKTVV